MKFDTFKAAYLLACLLLATIGAVAQQTHQVVLLSNQAPQLSANAGLDVLEATSSTIVIGGAPPVTGGTEPYSFNWNPSIGLSSDAVANPLLSLGHAAPTYTLTVTDARGCSASDEIHIEIIVTTLFENQDEIFFKIYPNPASEYLVIETSIENARVSMFDQNGKKLVDQRVKTGQNKIAINALVKGIYHITVEAPKGRKQSAKVYIK